VARRGRGAPQIRLALIEDPAEVWRRVDWIRALDCGAGETSWSSGVGQKSPALGRSEDVLGNSKMPEGVVIGVFCVSPGLMGIWLYALTRLILEESEQQKSW
jgi:hypothetical protein